MNSIICVLHNLFKFFLCCTNYVIEYFQHFAAFAFSPKISVAFFSCCNSGGNSCNCNSMQYPWLPIARPLGWCCQLRWLPTYSTNSSVRNNYNNTNNNNVTTIKFKVKFCNCWRIIRATVRDRRVAEMSFVPLIDRWLRAENEKRKTAVGTPTAKPATTTTTKWATVLLHSRIAVVAPRRMQDLTSTSSSTLLRSCLSSLARRGFASVISANGQTLTTLLVSLLNEWIC